MNTYCKIFLTLPVFLISNLAIYASDLPDKAQKTIEQIFPNAKIIDIKNEKEFGISYYSLEIKHKGKSYDVEVSADGVIGEVEYEIKKNEIPAIIKDAVAGKIKWSKIKIIEKHVRYGSAQDGKWVSLACPVVFYEIKYCDGLKKCEILINEQGKICSDPDDDNDHDKSNGDDED